MRSIERHLLIWVAGALALGMVAITLVTYIVTLEEMNEIFDADLKNVAAAVATYHHAGHGPDDADRMTATTQPGAADDSGIVTQTWNRARELVFASNPEVQLPFVQAEGLSRARWKGDEWVVYTLVARDGVIQAAQRALARSEIADESATKIFPPMLLLTLIVSALMVFALRRGLATLGSATRDVAARTEHALDPIATDDVPRELVPLSNAINGLMQRLASALSAQRRFLADAAHELRTPATALRLQLQLLERSQSDAARAAAMVELKAGVDRSQRLIEQLLQVARTGPDGEPLREGVVLLGDLVRAAVAGMRAKADHRCITLVAKIDANAEVPGDSDQLTVLLNNLVENAIRYTPEGGTISVGACRNEGEGAATLWVIDDGVGIPPEERERVFERFYRGEGADGSARPEGSGLGLAIVRAIADRHHAIVRLATPQSGRGLEVRVIFSATLVL